MKTKERGHELKAGIFVVVGLLVFTLAVFLLGKKSALFSRNTDLFVAFNDISGLAVGAPVRLAGLEVGAVGKISFPEDPNDKQARVRLVVQSRFMPRIREDSEAFIDSAGLLGDKVVNISMGSPAARALHDGSTLKARRTATFESLTANLGQVVQSLVNISSKVEGIVEDERTAQVQGDVSRITASVANIMSALEKGDGLAHRILYDRAMGTEASATLAAARAMALKAQTTMERLDAIVAEVERGDGSAHELIYGESGKDALASLGQAAQEIATVVHAVKDGDGVLHALVYERDGGNFLRELNETAVVLNRIVADVDKGRGTIGGLLRDPTVYEDLKTVLGNVQRNVVFKALVRYTMENEQLRRADQAPVPRPASGEPETADSRAQRIKGSTTKPSK